MINAWFRVDVEVFFGAFSCGILHHDYSCGFILIKFARLVSGCEMSELMFMALDKNYIDTTTFDVIQPAINYYLKE